MDFYLANQLQMLLNHLSIYVQYSSNTCFGDGDTQQAGLQLETIAGISCRDSNEWQPSPKHYKAMQPHVACS